MNSCCNQFVRNNIQIAVCCLFLQAKILFSNKKKEKKSGIRTGSWQVVLIARIIVQISEQQLSVSHNTKMRKRDFKDETLHVLTVA
jgi:hypothetical protein